ncbi:MAG: GNAT family N-acetyltransferase [Dokdonella sp.]
MPTNYSIRLIETRDDLAIARVIRSVMPEFGASGAGFAIHDVEVDAMSAAYARPRCAYFVVEVDDVVLGGGGIAPLEGADAATCELRKMYFLPALRGRGAGSALIARCLDAARLHAFTQCYIETLTGMDAAQTLYLANGFGRIEHALGNTGHHGCNRFYLRQL